MEPNKRAWERLSIDEVRRLLAFDLSQGIRHEDVQERARLYGKNKLVQEKQHGVLGKILAQFKGLLVLILLGAGVINLFIALTVDHEAWVDTIVIGIALLINVIVGALQEERASKAFEKLNASQEQHALVVRDGKKQNILAEDLVPGDLVVLQGGYYVPADVRLLEVKDLEINEAALTGEWLAVSKSVDVLSEDLPLAERKNMAYMGTLIESGTGRGVVVATGSKTEIGEIALSLGTIDNQVTPLQRSIRKVAKFLSYVVALALVCILVLGLLRGESIEEMLLIAVAVAVATVPSGLPAAVTVVLAIGMESILKKGGLVRNLLAAETLGATTVILTDKTGTLTEARMHLSGLYSPQGVHDKRVDRYGDNAFLLQLAVMESNAFVEESEESPAQIVVHGDPIDKAIILGGMEAGLVQDVLFKEYRRLDALQFTSVRRFGVSLHHNPHKKTNRLVLAGEPEKLLRAASYMRKDGKREKLTDIQRKKLFTVLEENARLGKRMIGVAYRDASFDTIPETTEEQPDELLKQLVFAGFISFEDPIRADVSAAIGRVHQAGAHVIMLTGDNPETAHHIAREVGITHSADELVIRGQEIDDWDDQELYTKLQLARVIARATPKHKLRIARVLKNNHEVVAMTGDGINDAPALRAANIGVSVGSGTEVAKEASDLVLIDNSFSIIVSAIAEGRRIIDNLRKIVAYLLSTSFTEIFLLGGALIGGAPLPLVPAQILWGNIVEEGFMSFSFAFEKKDPHIMKRNPRSAQAKTLLNKQLRTLIVMVSSIIGIFSIVLYYWLLSYLGEAKIDEIRTIMFVTLALDAIFFTFSLKSLDTMIWRINFFDNLYLLGAFTVSVSALLLALLWPPLMTLLSLTPLLWWEGLLLVGVGLVNLATIEFFKWLLFVRKFKKEAEVLQPVQD